MQVCLEPCFSRPNRKALWCRGNTPQVFLPTFSTCWPPSCSFFCGREMTMTPSVSQSSGLRHSSCSGLLMPSRSCSSSIRRSWETVL